MHSALMSAAYQLHLLRARESYSLPLFSKNVETFAVGKIIYWIKTRVWFIPARCFTFLLLELFISKTALGTFWENAQNFCFLFVVFFTAGKICFKYAFRLLIHFN